MGHCYRSFCHLYGDRLLFELTANEIQEWLEVRCLGKSTNTYNHYLMTVRAMYTMAIKRKWVVENVSLEVEKLTVTPASVGVLRTPRTIFSLRLKRVRMRKPDVSGFVKQNRYKPNPPK